MSTGIRVEECPLAHSSTLSQSRSADTFIWWSGRGLIACFASSVIGPITPPTLLRWLDMMATYRFDEMVLMHATLRRIRPVMWSPDEKEQVLHDELLRPGDYVCRFPANDTLPFSTANLPFDCSFGSHSHKFWQDLNEKDADRTLLALDIIDDSLYREASKCDGGECAFTGPRIGNVHWIFPPSLISTMTTPAAERLFVLLEADFQESHNLLNMEDDIYQLWHQNAFSVDVDDDYRIRIFDKKAMNAGLPSHLKHIPAGGASDLYFHEHFRHTLTLHLCGGDMGENVGHMDYNLKDNTLTAAVRKCLEEKKLEEGVKELIVRDYEEYELEKRLKAANVWSEDDGETEEDCEPAE